MRIINNQVSPTTTRATDVKSSQATKDAFLGKMERNNRIDKKIPGDDNLISRDELASIAFELKDGSITSNEASERFVGSVVSNSVGKKLSSADIQKISAKIGEFFGQDKEFQQDLEKNLRRLV